MFVLGILRTGRAPRRRKSDVAGTGMKDTAYLLMARDPSNILQSRSAWYHQRVLYRLVIRPHYAPFSPRLSEQTPERLLDDAVNGVFERNDGVRRFRRKHIGDRRAWDEDCLRCEQVTGCLASVGAVGAEVGARRWHFWLAGWAERHRRMLARSCFTAAGSRDSGRMPDSSAAGALRRAIAPLLFSWEVHEMNAGCLHKGTDL